MRKIQILKVNHLIKNSVNFAKDTGTKLPSVDKSSTVTKKNHKKNEEPNYSFYQYMKKDQKLPNKNIHSKNSFGKPLPSNSNYSRNQSPYNPCYRGKSPEQKNSRKFSQN